MAHRTRGHVQTVEVDIECEDDHCEDYTSATCPLRSPTFDRKKRLAEEVRIQGLWRDLAPPGERLCSWRRTDAEPWATLARLLDPPE